MKKVKEVVEIEEEEEKHLHPPTKSLISASKLSCRLAGEARSRWRVGVSLPGVEQGVAWVAVENERGRSRVVPVWARPCRAERFS